MEELLDKMVLEQFLNTLNTDTRIWVRERKLETSVEAGRLADDHCVQARKQGKDGAATAREFDVDDGTSQVLQLRISRSHCVTVQKAFKERAEEHNEWTANEGNTTKRVTCADVTNKGASTRGNLLQL